MKKMILLYALLNAVQLHAQVSILDILPADVKHEIEVVDLYGMNDTSIFTYDIHAIDMIENLVFVEHRVNRFTDAKVYKITGTPFKLRLVTPDKDDEIQDPFIRVYRNDI